MNAQFSRLIRQKLSINLILFGWPKNEEERNSNFFSHVWINTKMTRAELIIITVKDKSILCNNSLNI